LTILCDLLNPLNDGLKIRAEISGLEGSEWGALQRHIETRSLASSLYARLNQEALLPCLPAELREFLRENYLINAAATWYCSTAPPKFWLRLKIRESRSSA